MVKLHGIKESLGQSTMNRISLSMGVLLRCLANRYLKQIGFVRITNKTLVGGSNHLEKH